MGRHEASGCHKEAVEKLIVLPATTTPVEEMLSSQLSRERKAAREHFLLILRGVKFLARQGLALRGSAADDGHEGDGNFLQILQLFQEFHPSMQQWMERRRDRYTSGDIQNEMLKVMSLRVLRGIAENIGDRAFSIMVDETTDASVVEQCVIVIRWVDDSLQPYEDFIGFYGIPQIDANTIVAVIRDSLIRMNLKLAMCRGQCYDGAAVMKGHRQGVATQILKDQPKALYTHCYGHALNLACQDMIREVKVVKDALDNALELSKLLQYSAKRNAEYKRLKAKLAPQEAGVRTLCPTRWTVRAAALASILSNYECLQACLEKFTEMSRYDREMSARCNGLLSQFSSFSFLFGVFLGKEVLTLADNLSTALQKKVLSAADGQVSE